MMHFWKCWLNCSKRRKMLTFGQTKRSDKTTLFWAKVKWRTSVKWVEHFLVQKFCFWNHQTKSKVVENDAFSKMLIKLSGKKKKAYFWSSWKNPQNNTLLDNSKVKNICEADATLFDGKNLFFTSLEIQRSLIVKTSCGS